MPEPPIEDETYACVEVTRPDTHAGLTCIYLLEPCEGANASLFDASAEFDGAEVGESIVLTLARYTASELRGLEDFDGW